MTISEKTVKAFIKDESMAAKEYTNIALKLRGENSPLLADAVMSIARDEARHWKFWKDFKAQGGSR